MGEKEIVELLEAWLKSNYYFTVKELVVNSTVIDLMKVVGQEVLRIDLAALSMIDGSIVFIEAEREAYIDHPAMYKPVADYVFLACPLSKLERDDVSPVALEDLYNTAVEKGVGILGVFKTKYDGELCFNIKANASITRLPLAVRQVVLDSFEKRGCREATRYIPWWYQ